MIKRNTTDILGIRIDCVKRTEAIERLKEMLDLKSQSIISTPNTEMIIKAQIDEDFRDILNNRSKMNLADGVGLLWAAKFLSLSSPRNGWRYLVVPLFWLLTILMIPFSAKFFRSIIPDKIPGSDFIWDMARLSAKENNKLFLLGGVATVAERAALKLQTDIPGLKIAGVYSGLPKDAPGILDAVNRSRPDVLLICLGSPKQERWLSDNLAKTTAKIGIGLGGSFDFIAGERQRAPKWLQRIGFEWLFRLIQEPARFQRQLAIPKFMWLVLLKKLR